MPIDVNQLLLTFVEESMEMLAETEKSLLELELSAIDTEAINRIFRFMHSIKGSSSIFNLTYMTEFTHSLETFLGRVRSFEHSLTQDDISLMLKAVDVLRSVLNNIQNKQTVDESQIHELNAIFKEKIQSATTASTHNTTPIKTQSIALNKWVIHFNPTSNFFERNHDPMRLFSTLNEMGTVRIKADVSQLPAFDELNFQKCYLRWIIEIETKSSKQEILDAFSWVAEKSEISFNDDTKLHLTQEPKVAKSQTSSSVRVSTEKIDNIINIIGELIITQSMLNQITKDFNITRLSNLYEGLEILEHNSRELQSTVMRIRMVPIEFVFSRFPRMVHDIAKKLNKSIELVINGEQTEIDKNMIEKITDPLLHLIRNAMDHGIESKEIRRQAGKPEIGTIQLNAYQDGGNIVIDVLDDGAGLDQDSIYRKAVQLGMISENQEISEEKLYQMIFQPGFSTSESVSDISGRGVGLDVVYKNISELGGEVNIFSVKGEGSTFSIRFPLTLAIMDCQLVRIAEQVYIIPLITISEIIRVDTQHVNKIDEYTTVYLLRENYIPIIFLCDVFSIPNSTRDLNDRFLVIVDINDQQYGLVVDELLSQQQVVIKNLEENFKKISGISGITILGDGSVALIVDVNAVVNMAAEANINYKNEMMADKNVIKLDEEAISIEDEKLADKDNFQFLSFILADQEYGIDILSVKEIRIWEDVTVLPNTPSYIKGVINVRGNIIPVVDLCDRFALPHKGYGPTSTIIILIYKSNHRQRCIGIVVDRVMDTYKVNKHDIKALSENGKSELKKYILGLVSVDNKMITLLKTKTFISEATVQEI